VKKTKWGRLLTFDVEDHRVSMVISRNGKHLATCRMSSAEARHIARHLLTHAKKVRPTLARSRG
jgi:hypothetical protein